MRKLALMVLLILILSAAVLAAGPPKVPAEVVISVAPESLQPGSTAQIELVLKPKAGIKINRYPKIKFKVAAQDGLTAGAENQVGNEAPPPPDKMDDNYYGKGEIPPVPLSLPLDASIKRGKHELEAKLTYFYCVAASGFCAPKRATVKIPIQIR